MEVLNSANPGVTVTLNQLCRNSVDYRVLVSLGLWQSDGDCAIEQTITATIEPGQSKLFLVDTSIVSQGVYCYKATLSTNSTAENPG